MSTIASADTPKTLTVTLDNVITVRTGQGEIYTGPYTVDPSATSSVVLATSQKTMTDNVTVNKIRTAEVSNPTGYTYYIASTI